MSAQHQWYSLSVKWSESDWLEALPWPVRSIWPEFLAKVKQNGKNGRLPSTSLKRFAGSSDIPLEYVEQFFAAAFAEGAVTIDELDRWTVTNWDEYQIDSVEARKRKQEQRARDKAQKQSESREVKEEPDMSRDNLENHDMSRDIDQKTGGVTESPVTRDHQTTRPPDKENKYKQEEITSLLPNGNEKPLKAPDLVLAAPPPSPWWDDPGTPHVIRDAVFALCQVARFRKRFENPEFAVIERETMFRCLEKSRQKKFPDSEFVALAQSCMNYFASKKSNVSGSLSLENWIRNQRVEVQKPKSGPGDWMGKTFGRGDDRQVTDQIIEGDVIHAKFG